MAHNRWPNIGPDELRQLWERHAPPFLKIDDPDRDIPKFRNVFLGWLEEIGVDLGPANPVRKPGRRLRLEGVSFVRRGVDAETAVALSLNGTSTEVRRSGRASPDEILRLSAETTLDALHQLVPTVGFGVERAFTVEPALPTLNTITIVVVRNTISRPPEQFIGAADVSASSPEAAAKATLDAVNRRVERATAELVPVA